jgi:hypothetical protein
MKRQIAFGFRCAFLFLLVSMVARPFPQAHAAARDDTTSDPYMPAIFDCAANSMYVYGKLIEKKVDLGICKALLPLKDGNTLDDMVQAGDALGLKLQVYRVSPVELASLQSIAIALFVPRPEINNGTSAPGMGHYVVLRPIDSARLQVLDFKRDASIVVERQDWAMHLQKTFENMFVISDREPVFGLSSATQLASNEARPGGPSQVTQVRDHVDLLDVDRVAIWEVGQTAATSINHTYAIRN